MVLTMAWSCLVRQFLTSLINVSGISPFSHSVVSFSYTVTIAGAYAYVCEPFIDYCCGCNKRDRYKCQENDQLKTTDGADKHDNDHKHIKQVTKN